MKRVLLALMLLALLLVPTIGYPQAFNPAYPWHCDRCQCERACDCHGCVKATPTQAPTPTKTATPRPTQAPTAFPSFGPTIQPTLNIAPSELKWESNMRQFGASNCAFLKDPAGVDPSDCAANPKDCALQATYYDGIFVYQQIRSYTNDPSWDACVNLATASYRDQYVISNNGSVPGYWSFTRGLANQSSSDAVSRQAVDLLATNAAYASDSTPLPWTVDSLYSREVAYTILAYLGQEAQGERRRPRLAALVDQAFGHLDQWFVNHTAMMRRPFMVGLTARSLIYFDQATHDARTLPELLGAADAMWAEDWLPLSNSFRYTNLNTKTLPPKLPNGDVNPAYDTGGTEPAPDLNLLIAPLYSWLWMQTAQAKYRDEYDQIFAGGVAQADLSNGKHMDQNYLWTFEGKNWRHPH